MVIREYTDTDGAFATVLDDNLAKVTTLYGFVQPAEYEDGSLADFFMVVAEEPAYPTEIDDLYLAATWDHLWLTVEYDPEETTTWIPAFFTERFVMDGQEYKVYAAEIDYYQADKDYSGQEFPYDLATMRLVVDENSEVVGYDIETYKVLFSGPDDEEGEVRFDKVTFELAPGDAIQFWNFGFNMRYLDRGDWFLAGDVATFVQQPVFRIEFFEFEGVDEYYYAIWAEDASGNATLGELVPTELIADSPFGTMLIYEDPWGNFQVQVPQTWAEEQPDISTGEIFRKSDMYGIGSVSIYVEEDIGTSLAEYAEWLEYGFLEADWEVLDRYNVQTAQGLPAEIFEMLANEGVIYSFTYLSDDGAAITIAYTFPIDLNDEIGATLYSMARYSFDTFVVN